MPTSIPLSILALMVDLGATILTQVGYVYMKFGQLSKEEGKKVAQPQSKFRQFRNSGFFTCRWLIGFLISTVGATLHACECISNLTVFKVFCPLPI